MSEEARKIMTLEEARRIVSEQDTSDHIAAIEAVAVLLRFNGIADPSLLPIAQSLESVVNEQRLGSNSNE